MVQSDGEGKMARVNKEQHAAGVTVGLIPEHAPNVTSWTRREGHANLLQQSVEKGSQGAQSRGRDKEATWG